MKRSGLSRDRWIACLGALAPGFVAEAAIMDLESVRSRIYEAVNLALQGQDFVFDSDKMMHRIVAGSGVECRIIVPFDLPHASATFRCSMNIGIHCPGFEQSLSEVPQRLCGRPLSVCQNIGQLMGLRHWKFWEVSDAWPTEQAAKEITDALVRYGLPWIRTFDSVKAMWRWLLQNRRSSDWRQLQLFEQYAWRHSEAIAS